MADECRRGRSRANLVQRGSAGLPFAHFTPVGVRAGVLPRWAVTKPDLVDLAHDAIELHSDLDLSLKRCSHCLTQWQHGLASKNSELPLSFGFTQLSGASPKGAQLTHSQDQPGGLRTLSQAEAALRRPPRYSG